MDIRPYLKFIVALIGAVIVLANELAVYLGHLWDDEVGAGISTVVAFLTAIGVYLARNADVVASIAEGRPDIGDRDNPLEAHTDDDSG